MSTLFIRSSAIFDKLFEKATSHLLLEPEWESILEICDCIRQEHVQPKYVLSCIKKKLYAQNQHVVLYTLQVLESCMKNCGTPFHTEVASVPFMEDLKELVHTTTNENVRSRILGLIQTWAHAFRNEPKYHAVQDIFNMLKMDGYKPRIAKRLQNVPKESNAMFTAPDWADGFCCYRCKTQFTAIEKKHHCRNCGQVFCFKCSSQTSPLSHFGIKTEVSVCEICWEKLNNRSATIAKSTSPNPEQSLKYTAENCSSVYRKREQMLNEQIALLYASGMKSKQNNWVTKVDENNYKTIYSVQTEAEHESAEQHQAHQNMSFPKRMTDEREQDKDQWSPLNPEGKKQFDRNFLLQLQTCRLSLCKPRNFPNLNMIKDKKVPYRDAIPGVLHEDKLMEIKRHAPHGANVSATIGKSTSSKPQQLPHSTAQDSPSANLKWIQLWKDDLQLSIPSSQSEAKNKRNNWVTKVDENNSKTSYSVQTEAEHQSAEQHQGHQNMSFPKRMTDEREQEKGQWSPLNPEGKKQFDRNFLLQLKTCPLSLCKPRNLPNLNMIKDKKIRYRDAIPGGLHEGKLSEIKGPVRSGEDVPNEKELNSNYSKKCNSKASNSLSWKIVTRTDLSDKCDTSTSISINGSLPSVSQAENSEKHMSRSCHNCGTNYPIVSAKYCCECGARRFLSGANNQIY